MIGELFTYQIILCVTLKGNVFIREQFPWVSWLKNYLDADVLSVPFYFVGSNAVTTDSKSFFREFCEKEADEWL